MCSVDSCDRRVYGKGLCNAHYQRLKLKGDVQAERELWTRSHPDGQRVEDVLAWARAFVARYG